MAMLDEVREMRVTLAVAGMQKFEANGYDKREFDNIAENAKRRLGKFPSLRSLNIYRDGRQVQGYLTGQTVFLVAAGESLDRNYHHLTRIANSFSAHIVAVDRSGWYLCQRGINADAVVSIESLIDKSALGGMPSPYPDPDAHLWTVATAHPDFVARWPGQVFFGFPLFQGNEEKLAEATKIAGPLPRFGSGSNCSSTALAICAYLGAKRIVFVGHDFCVDEKPYAGQEGGSVTRHCDSGWTNRAGRTVRVPYSYLTPKLWTEEMILGGGKNMGIEFINATEGGILGLTKNGAEIDGMRFMALEDAVTKYAPIPEV